MNYFVILFKNRKKKRIINKFVTETNAFIFFNKMIEKSNEIFFEKKLEHTKECTFELGIVSNTRKYDTPTYIKDELGRSFKVSIEGETNNYLIEIKPYYVEEKIYDIAQNKKITIKEFEKTYLKKEGLKVASVLNHKIVLQNDTNFNLFSLKTESEAIRFLDSLISYLSHIGNLSTMIIKDTSAKQKKYLYDLLINNGFDSSILYRKFTTHPRTK
jgi:hypothetical protein